MAGNRLDSPGTKSPHAAEKLFVSAPRYPRTEPEHNTMNNIIYIVGLVVVVIAVLSFFGLR